MEATPWVWALAPVRRRRDDARVAAPRSVKFMVEEGVPAAGAGGNKRSRLRLGGAWDRGGGGGEGIWRDRRWLAQGRAAEAADGWTVESEFLSSRIK